MGAGPPRMAAPASAGRTAVLGALRARPAGHSNPTGIAVEPCP